MRYLATLTTDILRIERAKIRGWSAMRRAVVVVGALLVFGAIFSPEVGAVASVAALYVGLQDRGADPLRYTLRVMMLETLLLAAIAALAGFANHAWNAAIVLVVLAGLAGLFASRDKALSRMFADIIAVEAFLGLQTVSDRQAAAYVIGIVTACGMQILLTRLAFPFSSDLPERRPIAAALKAVADHLDDAQLRQKQGTGPAAEAALAAAEASVNRADLSHDRRRAMRRILTSAEALRQEATALRARRAFDVAVIEDADVDYAADLAITTLLVASRVLLIPRSSGILSPAVTADMRLLTDYHQRAKSLAHDADARPSARAIADQTRKLIKQLRRLLASSGDNSSNRLIKLSDHLTQDWREFGARDMRAGFRLMVAASLALLAANALQLSHGGWVAATAVALLRPDHRALTEDTIARALGTAIGAVLVLPLVWLTMGEFWAYVAMVAVLAYLTYVITSANEGLFVIAITIETVFTRAVVGENPIEVATSRMVDVLLGCAIAVLLLLVMPLRHGKKLRYELAEYARISSNWLLSVADLAETGTASGWKKHHRRLRLARVSVQHGLDVRRVEPLGKGIPAWLAADIFNSIHDTERLAMAAEASLRHGGAPDAQAAGFARSAAADLAKVADIIDKRPVDVPPAVPRRLPQECDSEISELLAGAARESRSALRRTENTDWQAFAQTSVRRALS